MGESAGARRAPGRRRQDGDPYRALDLASFSALPTAAPFWGRPGMAGGQRRPRPLRPFSPRRPGEAVAAGSGSGAAKEGRRTGDGGRELVWILSLLCATPCGGRVRGLAPVWERGEGGEKGVRSGTVSRAGTCCGGGLRCPHLHPCEGLVW